MRLLREPARLVSICGDFALGPRSLPGASFGETSHGSPMAGWLHWKIRKKHIDENYLVANYPLSKWVSSPQL